MNQLETFDAAADALIEVRKQLAKTDLEWSGTPGFELRIVDDGPVLETTVRIRIPLKTGALTRHDVWKTLEGSLGQESESSESDICVAAAA